MMAAGVLLRAAPKDWRCGMTVHHPVRSHLGLVVKKERGLVVGAVMSSRRVDDGWGLLRV